ncbi:MAG: hypothetical protein V1799_17540 [bacterium]
MSFILFPFLNSMFAAQRITIVLATLARLVMSNRNLIEGMSIVLAPFRAATQIEFS